MIKDLKELQKFFKICRENGVESIKFYNVEVFLRPGFVAQPSKKAQSVKADNLVQTDDIKVPFPEIDEPDELTEEQKLFGSADPSVWDKAN